MADKNKQTVSKAAAPAPAKTGAAAGSAKKKTPSNFSKRAALIKRDSDALKAEREKAKANAQKNKQYYLESGKKHWEEFEKHQKHIVDATREAKKNNSFFVPDEPKFFFVIRIKGLNRIPPKEKKILRLFRLRQLHNAVFVKNSKATMNMLRKIEPWVTFGTPSRGTIRKLIYKRGYGKVNGQRIPLSSNTIVEGQLGKHNIKSIEDLIHEIWSCGEHFKEANAFLWPFKLDSPKGGLSTKRHSYLNGGDFGPREEFINKLTEVML